jgi:hypothetical protein
LIEEVKIKKAKLFLAWQLGWSNTDRSQLGGPFRWVAQKSIYPHSTENARKK